MSELKPCRFHKLGVCEVSVFTDVVVNRDNSWYSFYQVVADCGARGPEAKTREEAIEAWNKREEGK